MPITDGTADNLRSLYQAATPIEIDEGLPYYFRLHRVVESLAAYYGYSFHKAAAVFAALSPNVGYKPNLKSAATVLARHREGIAPEFVRVATYNACRDRAYTYLDGVDFWETVKGPKIRHFYRNIIEPWRPEFVTIDGHAANAWKGFRKVLEEVAGNKGEGGGFNYRRAERDFKIVAKELGILPNQLQAILWYAWKRKHNILAPVSYQQHFFRDNSDLWEVTIDPADVALYENFDTPHFASVKEPVD